MNARAPVQVGDLLAGKYRVERVLGAGAMGVVVAARHSELKELRALKFMQPDVLDNETAVERFLREARAVAGLKSQHVVRVHDVGRLDDGAPYIVMEYLEGQDLRHLIKARERLPVGEAVLYVLQASEAIEEAHAAGIIHRDLKPANLFLTKGFKGAPCIKVLDFGVAKRTPKEGEAEVELTNTAAPVGTPSYMSPEQMRVKRRIDGRSDIWSLGVVLYKLLSGRVPFPGSDIAEICTSILCEDPEPLAVLCPDMPPALEAIIRRCLEKDPDRRFPDVAALREALAPFAEGPASVSPLSTAAPLPAPAAEEPSSHTAGTAPPWSQGGSLHGAPRPRSSSGRPVVIGAVALAVVGAAIGGVVLFQRSAPASVSAAVVAPASADTTASASASASVTASVTASAPVTVPASVTAPAIATAKPGPLPPQKPKGGVAHGPSDAFGNSRK